MKKLFLFFVLISTYCKTQIVFSPPGAEWNYNFYNSAGGNPAQQSIFNEKIKYVRDSMINGSICKVLSHSLFYLECSSQTNLTLIKQSGDTVFMRNQNTQHKWEILYNFNVKTGDSWQTKLLADHANPAIRNYTITVDSVNQVTFNTVSLKKLFVKYSSNNVSPISSVITELYGNSSFLFNYYNSSFGICDGVWFKRFLCYSDAQYGNKQFTEYPCNYVNPVNLYENDYNHASYKVYPNPTSNLVIIEQNSNSSELELILINVLGKEIKRTIVKDKLLFDLSGLYEGIYFVEVWKDGNKIGTNKIIKN